MLNRNDKAPGLLAVAGDGRTGDLTRLFWDHATAGHRGIAQQLHRASKRPNSSGEPHLFTFELMTEFPITLDIWQKAIDQRMRENEAQARYQEARERLFDAIRPRQ
jgi:hypothetical protein